MYGTILAIAVIAWFALSLGTYAGIRVYLHHRGEPHAWRFNHHGARAIPGHVSFYPEDIDRTEGVVVTPVTLFPLFWKVRTGRSRSELETVHRSPVWRAFPWAYRYMENAAALSIWTDIREKTRG